MKIKRCYIWSLLIEVKEIGCEAQIFILKYSLSFKFGVLFFHNYYYGNIFIHFFNII